MARSGLIFVHKAILREAEGLEAAVARMDDAEALMARLQFFDELVHHHTDGEEQFFFPEIEKRAPRSCATYLFDHKDERKLFATLAGAVRQAAAQPAARQLAHRTAVALVEHLDSHIRKENEIVLPLVEELFTPAEHEAMVARISGAIPPQMMARVLPWMIQQLDPPDRVEFLSAVPAERRPMMIGLLRANLPAAVWSELEKSL